MSENMREAYTIKVNFLTKERKRENVNFSFTMVME